MEGNKKLGKSRTIRETKKKNKKLIKVNGR